MKKRLILILLVGFGAIGCSRECGVEDPVCLDTPPGDEACAAYFTRWFYSIASNSCTEIGYSGCSERGFATKAECEACDCK